MKYKLYLLFFVFCLCVGSAYAQIITTIAGGGSSGLGDGAEATSCELSHPGNILIDGAGDVYIADVNNNRIRKINAVNGIIVTIAGIGAAGYSGDTGAATAAKIKGPVGMIFDNSGNLFFADDYNNCVRKIDASGIISTVAGTGTAGYSGDNGIAIAAELNRPHYLAFDNIGNLYITDWGNNRIRKVSNSGIITTIAGIGMPGHSGDNGPATAAKVNEPYGIAIDGLNNIYFADFGSNYVRKIDPSGVITTIAGTGIFGYNGDGIPAISAELNQPCGIALDKSGNLYVADAGNERVRKVNPLGIITTIAGIGTLGFSGDGGPAILAELDPIGVSLDGSDNLYIADYANNRIRFVRNTLVVDEINSFSALSLYPNPNVGRFTIHTQLPTTQELKITIADMLGRSVKEITTFSTDPVEMDISELPMGVYVVKVRGEDWEVVTKVVKE
jgi:sugar lactone lactonase YvrE